MKTIIHKADTRGFADHGWLKSFHTFSFAGYYDPQRIHFGALRVLNDDTIAGGTGFGTHPHDNMEIISIPLSGDLEHQDSMGNRSVIREGDIQVMSAGTGVRHSEYNKNKDKECKFLQIWVFPREKDLEPRYDQISLKDLYKNNSLYQVLSPDKNGQGVWINQDAWFHLGNLSSGTKVEYILKGKNHGVYLFLLEGNVRVGESELKRRDGMGITEAESFELTAEDNSRLLLMEVPMSVN